MLPCQPKYFKRLGYPETYKLVTSKIYIYRIKVSQRNPFIFEKSFAVRDAEENSTQRSKIKSKGEGRLTEVNKKTTDLTKKEPKAVLRVKIFVQSSWGQYTRSQTHHGSGGLIANAYSSVLAL